jgi:iodothyronine deiodinase-like protein
LPSNVRDQVVYESPADMKAREQLADVCVTRLGIKIPAVVDRFDDSTEIAYSGWPDRLYVIDGNGRIAYKSKPGPFGFKPAEMESALRALLPAPPAH